MNEDLQQQGNLDQTQQQAGEQQTDDTGRGGQQAGEQFINQEAVQRAINRQHQKYQQERTRRLTAEEKLAQAEAKIAELQAAQKPVIPDMPDTLDPDFNAKVQAREKAIRDQAVWDQQEQIRQRQAQQQQQTVQTGHQQQMQQTVAKYYDRAGKLGVDAQKLQAAEQQIAGFLAPGVANHLLTHKQGPLIVKHLADNILDLDNLANLSDTDAAVHIAQKIVPKLGQGPSGKINPDDELDDSTDTGGVSRHQPKTSRDFMRGVTME